jgi:clan AA aspartic protease
MITGVVTAYREAIVRLRLRATSGLEVEVEAVLDTGFTEYLSLPLATIQALNLPQISSEELILADGGRLQVAVYEGTVVWDGQDRTIYIHCLEGSPLLGMFLLFDHLLTMEVVNNGPLTIAPIP